MGVVRKIKDKILLRNRREHILYDLIKRLLTPNGSLLYAGQMLRFTAKRFPQQTALIFNKHAVTYQELYFRAALLTKTLWNNGVSRGDRVFLQFENSIEFFIGYFAIWQSGAVCVPLNTFLHARELKFIIDDAQPKAIITSQKLAEKLDAITKDFPTMVLPQIFTECDINWDIPSPSSIDDVLATIEEVRLEDDELCLLLYTSGTTGVPKGVMLSSKNIMTNCIQCAARLGCFIDVRECLSVGKPVDERYFAALPLFHVFAQNTCMWFPIVLGGTIVVVPRIERKEIVEGLKERPTLFFGVPALYGLLCLMKNANLDSIKFFVSGGDAMPNKIRLAFAMIYGRQICAGYGLTEAAPVVAVNIYNGTKPTNSVGDVLIDIDFEIRNEQGTVLGHDEVGTLWIKGDNIMLGYYNAPHETTQILQDGWLNTGDLASYDVHHHLSIVGRSKDLIIHKGFNIYPQEIENVLLTHPAVFKAAVIGKADSTTGQIPVAFVALKTDQENIERELRKFCVENLAAYKIPRKFICLEDLPISVTGKIDKKLLRVD